MQHITKNGFYDQLAIAMEAKPRGIFGKFADLWRKALLSEEGHRNVNYAILNRIINDIPSRVCRSWNQLDRERVQMAVVVVGKIRAGAAWGNPERETAADTAAAWLEWALNGAPESDGEAAVAPAPFGRPLLHLEPGDLFVGISRTEVTPSQHEAFLHLRQFHPQGWGSAPDRAVRLEHRMFVGRRPLVPGSLESNELRLTGKGTYQGWDYGIYERTMPDGQKKRHVACFLVDGGSVSRLHAQFIWRKQKWFVRKSSLCTGGTELRVHPPLEKGVPFFNIDIDSGDWAALTLESAALAELELRDGSVIALGRKLFLVEWN